VCQPLRRPTRDHQARSAWPVVGHLIDLAKLPQSREVDLVVLDQGIDTSTAVGRLFFQIIGAIAEFEHSLMSERTMDGLAAARARGRTGGQEPKLGPRQVRLARQMYDETGRDGKRRYTVAQIAGEFGVSRPTIYRHLAKLARYARPAARSARSRQAEPQPARFRVVAGRVAPRLARPDTRPRRRRRFCARDSFPFGSDSSGAGGPRFGDARSWANSTVRHRVDRARPRRLLSPLQ
jgi:hypothetical protein